MELPRSCYGVAIKILLLRSVCQDFAAKRLKTIAPASALGKVNNKIALKAPQPRGRGVQFPIGAVLQHSRPQRFA